MGTGLWYHGNTYEKGLFFVRRLRYLGANPGPFGHREANDADPAVFSFYAHLGCCACAGIGIACGQAKGRLPAFCFSGPNIVKEVPQMAKSRRTGENHPQMQ